MTRRYVIQLAILFVIGAIASLVISTIVREISGSTVLGVACGLAASFGAGWVVADQDWLR